jgi:hypothetical protein
MFVQHYAGYNVILGIWNEPNLNGVSTASYCQLFTNAASARNTYNSGFALAAPETSHHAMGDGYYASVMGCVAPYLASQDVVTVHWYNDGPDIAAYMSNVRTYENAPNNVWLSEVGWGTSDVNAQASFYANRMYNFETLGIARPWWNKIIFFILYDPGLESILYADWTNKPAFNTYKEWIADESGNTSGKMGPDTYLFANQQTDSANGLYHLYYQGDGNLVLYNQFWSPLWDSQTAGTDPGFAVMQGDGNLVVYDAGGVARYDSSTQGHPGGYAVVQDNGGFFIFDATGVPVKSIH